MDMSSTRWLSELGLDPSNFIDHRSFEFHSLDEFTEQLLINPADQNQNQNQNQNLQRSFSSESYTTAPKTFNGCQTGFERLTTEHQLTPKASNSSSSSNLSFANHPAADNPKLLYGNIDFSVKQPKEEKSDHVQMDFKNAEKFATKSCRGTKRAAGTITRTESDAQEHVMAERKRRERLSLRFIALSAILPGLKKMDKATILGDAIQYLKQLQERVKVLEEQTKKKPEELVVFLKKRKLSNYEDNDDDDDDDDSSSCDESFNGRSKEGLPEIEARVSDKNVLIRIHCKHQKGFIAKILSEIEKLHLSVVNSNVLPFGKYTIDITIVAQMDDEFPMKAMDIVRSLRSAAENFM